LANSLKLDQFILEGDSNIVILSLNNPTLSMDWHIDHVILETLASFQVSSHWEARKINRSANFCAQYAAYKATTWVFPGCIPSFSPPFLLFCCLFLASGLVCFLLAVFQLVMVCWLFSALL
jgi:hypothetical protein